MGLSISHRIITDHRGAIQCKGRRKGTVFEISLPAAKEEASADILPGTASYTSEGRETFETAYPRMPQRQFPQEN